MTSELQICVAIMAAGLSRRFAGGDKLVQMLGGKMLGLHMCETLGPMAFAEKFVIASALDHPCSEGWVENGFDIIPNCNRAQGLGASVALAAEQASARSADALLICLADMPFVPKSHIRRLVDAFEKTDGMQIVASSSGNYTSPPAIFGRSAFAQLTRLAGDNGARDLLARATTIPLDQQLMADIDTDANLERANTPS